MINIVGSATVYASGLTAGTVSVVVPSGGARVLVAAIGLEFSGLTIGTVTYGGQALTKITSTITEDCEAGLWRLINPPIGTANLIANASGTSNFELIGVALNSVFQVTPVNASGTSGGTSGNALVNITPTVNSNLIIDCMVSGAAGGGITKGANQTVIFDQEEVALDVGVSFKRQSAAGTTSMDWTISGGAEWAHVAASFTPSRGGILSGEI